MDRPYQAMWPTPSILASLDLNSDWRITSVKYKAYRDMFNLCAIQFIFDNGIASPWCEASNCREDDTEVEVEVDHRKEIVGIQARVYTKEGYIEGLRLIDEDGNYQFDETWYTFGTPSEWGDVLPIPETGHIIGYKCEIEDTAIDRLSFLLW